MDYHCVHEEADVRFKIIDWRLFSFFSALEVDPLGSGLHYRETWEIVPDGDDKIVRFNVDFPFHGDDVKDRASGPPVQAIKELYDTYGNPLLAGLKSYLEG